MLSRSSNPYPTLDPSDANIAETKPSEFPAPDLPDYWEQMQEEIDEQQQRRDRNMLEPHIVFEGMEYL